MELSRLSCCSVAVSSRPPPPAPEHTEEELSTANPSASSTSLSIRSLKTKINGFVSSMWFFFLSFYWSNENRHWQVVAPLTSHRDSCCTFSSQTDSAAQRSQSARTFSTCNKTPHILLLFSLSPEKNKCQWKSWETLFCIYFSCACTCERKHKILTLCFCIRWKFLSYIWRACSKFLHSSSDHGGDFSALKPQIHLKQLCKGNHGIV